MKNGFKIASLGGLLLTGSLLAQPAAAQFVYDDFPDCNDVNTLQAWGDAGGCHQQDKFWTLGTTDLALDSTVGFGLNVINGLDFHEITVGPFGGGEDLGAGTFDLTYSVEIVDDPSSPEDESAFRFFETVQSDSDVTLGAGGSVLVDKVGESFSSTDPLGTVDDVKLSDFTDQSTDGNNSFPPTPICVGCQPNKVTVTDTISISGATVSSFSNTYQQGDRRIPEPASLALFGIGLAGAGFASRRRRKS